MQIHGAGETLTPVTLACVCECVLCVCAAAAAAGARACASLERPHGRNMRPHVGFRGALRFVFTCVCTSSSSCSRRPLGVYGDRARVCGCVCALVSAHYIVQLHYVVHCRCVLACVCVHSHIWLRARRGNVHSIDIELFA